MDKENADKVFTMRIPAGLFDKFRDRCNENYQTMSEAIRDMIRKYIKEDGVNKLVETIHATDDLDNNYTLSVWQKFIEASTTAGTHWIPGIKTVYDQNGNHVNVVDYDKGEFMVVVTGTKLKRV